MDHSFILKTTDLSFHYTKDVKTLSAINLHVIKGSIYGFLGPNGSGKTTTLSLLLGLLKMQEGKIEIFGQEMHTDRCGILKKTGSLIESPSLYGHLNARENLEVYKPVYGVTNERITEVLKIAGLEDAGKKTVKKFSLGMKQRLSIALAILHKPELLILDEPSNGLDPNGIIELRELIRKLNKVYGMTILISSHILAEVEKMVSHVGIINKGQMLFQGTIRELQQLQQKDAMLQIHTSDNEKAYQSLKAYMPEREKERIVVAYKDPHQVASINRILIQNNLDVYLLAPAENNLEQLFINLTSN